MRKILFLTFITFYNLTAAQTTYRVDNFADKYFGKIYIDDNKEVFSKGWIAIFDKRNNKQIIKVNSEELAITLHDGKVLGNIKELPYGEQSQIMYEDYNFDGVKDFAIMDGQNSCYHGPSFKIFLATLNGFLLNPAFTKLAQEYCGMFEINPKTKRISTMTKSGCCYHEFSEFIVENNKPKAIKIAEEKFESPFVTYTEQNWNGTRMVKTTRKQIDLTSEEVKIVLSFKIEKKGKEVVLFNINDRILNYALYDKNNVVEFSYPTEVVYKNPDFLYDQNDNSITFKNKSAKYRIYSSNNNIGIEINTGGKTYNWIGNIKTKKGNLKDLLTTNLDNVVIN